MAWGQTIAPAWLCRSGRCPSAARSLSLASGLLTCSPSSCSCLASSPHGCCYCSAPRRVLSISSALPSRRPVLRPTTKPRGTSGRAYDAKRGNRPSRGGANAAASRRQGARAQRSAASGRRGAMTGSPPAWPQRGRALRAQQAPHESDRWQLRASRVLHTYFRERKLLPTLSPAPRFHPPTCMLPCGAFACCCRWHMGCVVVPGCLAVGLDVLGDHHQAGLGPEARVVPQQQWLARTTAGDDPWRLGFVLYGAARRARGSAPAQAALQRTVASTLLGGAWLSPAAGCGCRAGPWTSSAPGTCLFPATSPCGGSRGMLPACRLRVGGEKRCWPLVLAHPGTPQRWWVWFCFES